MASFWEEVAKQAAPGIAQVAVRAAAESNQARGDIMRLFVHDYAVTKEIQREATARGWGIQDSQNFRAPYGQLTVNSVSQSPIAQQSQQAPAEPAKKAGGFLKTLAMTALMATGGGGLVAAGGAAAYSVLKDQLNKPVQIAPSDLKIGVKFDPDKGGFDFGEAVPAK